jgi:nitrite reductase (cytochrome c-552)
VHDLQVDRVPTLLDEFGDDYWSASFNDELRPRVVELAEEGQDERPGEFGHVAIGCSDCHDPQTMDLRITRPSLLEALERQGVDILEASKDDMWALVCAQCHGEAGVTCADCHLPDLRVDGRRSARTTTSTD